MVRQRIVVSVLQRLDTAAANVLRFAAIRVKLIGVSLEEGGVTSSAVGRA